MSTPEILMDFRLCTFSFCISISLIINVYNFTVPRRKNSGSPDSKHLKSNSVGDVKDETSAENHEKEDGMDGSEQQASFVDLLV